jgi:predicted PurR-regulated permease PerM
VSFPPVVTAVICGAALYFARTVLVPIALAMLLAFLLAPVVSRLQRARLGRPAAAVLVVFLAALILAGVGWLVFDQAIGLATQMPNYRATISRKIASFRGARESGIGKAEATVKELGNELSSPSETQTPGENSEQDSRGKRSPAPSATVAHPLPVQIVPQNDPITSVRTFVGPFIGPIGMIAIIMVFTAFILVRQEDLRDRLFTLAGLSRFHDTTHAFDEATQRVGRYLLVLFVVNLGYGLVFGLALYLIGLPNALLWGILAGVLRFIPYIGAMTGAAMPIILALAVFDGWSRPLLALGAFIVIEMLVSLVIEPLLFSAHTGISSLAILVAAIFWAALWGPAGLLLSTPLTVCIVVVGRYIPQLEFLNVLFGDKLVAGADIQLYQRLRGLDFEGAKQLVQEYLQEKPIEELYDSVITPVLIFQKKDLKGARFGEAGDQFFFQSLKEIVEDLTVQSPAEGQEADSDTQAQPSPAVPASDKGGTAPIEISCFPARDERDEIVGMMLAHMLLRAGYRAHVVVPAPIQDMLEEISAQDEAVCISTLPPLAVFHTRKLYKQVRTRSPNSRIVIGLWGFAGNVDAMKTRLGMGESDAIVTTITEATRQIPLLIEAPLGR